MLALKAGPPMGAENVSQENQASFTGQASWSVALPDGVSAGDSLVALIGTDATHATGAGFEATGISGGGVTWQQVTGSFQSGNGSAEVWVGFGSTGTTGSTSVTASLAGAVDGHMVVSEVSGIAGIDTSSMKDGSAGTAPSATSITPHAGDFLVGLLTSNPATVVGHPTPDWSTFSLSAQSYAAEWQSDVAGTASAPAWAITPSAVSITLEAAFTTSASSSTPSAVGALANGAGTGVTTLAVTPQHAGDLLALVVKVGSTGVTASTVSGGGVATWARAEDYTGYSGTDLEIWTGTVTTTGASTLTVGFSTSVSAIYTGLAAQEFAGLGSGTVWGIDMGAGISNASSATVTFPKLTPAGAGELYFGYAAVANNASAGATAGFGYATTADGDVAAYDTAVSAATQPTASQSPAGLSGAAAVLITASTSTSAVPTVTAVNPSSGPTSGGTPVTITGTNFSGVTGVKFGTTAATGVVVNSTTSISATSPAGTGTVDVTVAASGGTSATTSADRYTYVSAPTVSAVSPTSGPTTGGTPVTITGTNLTGATAVKFGTAAATGVTVVSATSVTATSPAGTGTVDVTVTTPGGTSATSTSDQFTYTVSTVPTVTAVNPSSGPTSGGTPVTITGTNFSGVTGVKFGTTAATGVVVNSTTSISVTAPAGSAGAVDVTVAASGGTSATTSADQYTYTTSASTIAAVGAQAFKAGDATTTLSVTPQHLGDLMALAVKADSATVTASSVSGGGVGTWTRALDYTGYSGSDLEIWTGTVTTTGASTVTVTFSTSVTAIYTGLAGQEFSASSGASTVWRLDTATGISDASSTTVTFPKLTPSATGELYFGYAAVANSASAGTTSGFVYTTTSDGDVAAYDTAVSAAAQPTATQSPAGLSGGVAALVSASSSVPAPTVSAVSPTSGPTTGGTPVTITGTNLTGATAVKFGTAAATGVTVVSATSVTATSPAGTGTVDVTVTTPGGTSATSTSDQFTYTVSTVPTVTAVNPSSGPTSGGTPVTITGTNFSGVTGVKFGTTAATGVVVNSTTSISVTAPAGSAGAVDVTVAASGGTSATTSADQYTYVAAPTVTSVSPSMGPSTGGTQVTITGTNFTGTQAVEFGTVAAISFTVNSATSITATPRAESTGTVDVTVLTPGGTSATSSADHFTFVTPSPPTVVSVSPSSGPTSGGTSVTITGTNFTGASAVDFGSTAATGVVVNSATSITATAPAGTGTVDVTVTTPGGTSATGSADQFAYTASTVAITAVGTMASNASTAVTTLAVTPQHVGDLMLLAVKVASTSISASSVSGGGVGTWTRAEGPYTGYAGHDLEIWKGTVSTTGSSTITVTFSGSVTSISTGLVSQEFSGTGSGTTWGVDTGAGISNASSATVTFPKLTPSASGELYFAYAAVANTASAGTTSGFTYGLTPDGNVATYDTNVSAATQPTATQSPAGVSGGLGVLITATGSSVPAPTVTGVSPGSGSTAGGTSVTITGTNLTGATTVMFGATAATNVTVNSSTSVTATSPAEPAWQTDITVTASGGTSATGAADRYTFVAAAPVATGTPHVMVVMMENESYSDLIGNSAAPIMNQLAQDYGSATQSYAIGHPSLPNYIELLAGSNYGVTDDGTPQSEDISSSASTFANQLETAGISWRGYFESMPSDGYTGGDTGGTDPYGGEYYLQHHNPFVYFPAVTSLSDFDTNVVPLSTNFSTDLNSSSPPAFVWVTPNAVDDMHDGPLMADGDTVPTVGDAWIGNFIGGVQASSWYAAGGQIVIEFDEGLDSDTSGVGTAGEGGGGQIPTIVISSALAANPQQDATAVNTAGVLHSIEKLYGVPFLADAANTGNGNIDSLMTVAPSTTPTVTGVSPSSGPTGGGTPVTVTGTNFTGVTAVKFGTTTATGVTVNSTTSISATAPAGTGTVDVTVSASGGTSVTTSADHYTYAAAPTVTSVVPGSGPTSGGTSVTITGTNLTGATAVKFGTTAATGVTVNSATSVSATAPAGTGTVDVTVTTPGGTSATGSADQFTYVVSTTPTVTGVSPSSGPTGGGTPVTVTGTNFSGVTAVKFGTTAATGVTVNSTTSISATAPAGTGTVDVTVSASGGTSATSSADHYTYTSAAPTVTAVGTLANGAGDGTTTLAVSPQHVGDLLVLVVKADVATVTASSVSGGGASTWTRVEGPYAGYSGHDLEIWTGTVTTTGASTIDVTFSSSVTAIYTGLADQEFSSSSGSSTVWAVGTGAGISNASSTTVTFPGLTPSASGELYFAYDAVANTASAGTTAGFTYATTPDGDVATYDTNVSGAIQPTAKQSPAGVSGGVAVLVTAMA